MIIKRKKSNDNNDNNEALKNQQPLKEEASDTFDMLSQVTERQERRRGDRRRGYRRIEDRSLVSRAHEEAKIIKEQAEQDGFKDGLAKADNEIVSLQEAITSILDIKQQAYNYYKNDIAIIAVQVAQKILNKQVELNPETIVEIAENAINEISEEENKITFVINPEDELILSENLERNSAFRNKRATMLVQKDENIEKGSCRVITSSGQIDATFTSQLAIIKKAFEEGI